MTKVASKPEVVSQLATLSEPVAWRNAESEMITDSPAMVKALHLAEWEGLYTESQFREALAKQQAVMRQALDALNGLFGIPDALTGQGGGGVAVWRLGGSHHPREAIKALEEALK